MEKDSLFGIPMVRRRNRRALVFATYALLLILTAIILIFHPWVNVWVWFVLAFNVTGGLVFGKLVKQTTFPEHSTPAVAAIGIVDRPAKESLDERELSVRNAAYFLAFRILALYSTAFFVSVHYLLLYKPTLAPQLILALMIPVLVMVLTLPQAIVLWSEPDLPSESDA